MSNVGKFLVGALVVVNVGLVSLLLFRDRSLLGARAEESASEAVKPPEAPAAASGLAEREGGTAFVPEPALPPAPAGRGYEPASEVQSVPAPPADEPARTSERDERDQDEMLTEPEPAARSQRRASTHGTRRHPGGSSVAREESRVASTRLPEPPADWRSADERGGDRERLRAERSETVTVPAGTHVAVKLDVALHSRQVESGDRFEASLAEDLTVNGRRLARAGSEVTGRVVELLESGRVKGRETMKLTLTSLTLAGKEYRVDSSVASFSAADDHGKDAAVVSGATVVGAIIGGIAKGGRGAATGAATGAAAGTGVVLSTKGKPVVLASGTRLDFTLEDAVRVTLPPRSERKSTPEDEELPEGAGISRR